MKCPFCESPVSVTDKAGNPWFSCGSTKSFRSSSCLDREPLATELKNAKDRIKRLEDCAETAWGIIANVDSGSWQEQRADWREAATRWRDEQFHPELSERKAKEAKP